VADFLWQNSLFAFANYEEPDVVIADAGNALGRLCVAVGRFVFSPSDKFT